MTTSTLSNAEYQKAYYEANRENLSITRKAYYEANREKINAVIEAYRKANPEMVNAINKTYRESNREILSDRHKAWHKAHPYHRIIRYMATKCKVSTVVINELVPQELIEVKSLQLQLHRLINARA